MAEFVDHGLAPVPEVTDSVDIDCCCARLGVLQGLGGLGWHVVLVVLGQHLVGVEDAVRPSLPCATTPLPSLNRSGSRAGVGDRNLLRPVGDGKADRQALRFALEAALLDQAADTATPATNSPTSTILCLRGVMSSPFCPIV
jgi:hypothetical protein